MELLLPESVEKIFIDTSVKSVSNCNWYEDYLYHTHLFSHLNLAATEIELKDGYDFLDMLQLNNVLTVRGVVEEIRREREILLTSIKYLKNRELLRKPHSNPKKNHGSHQIESARMILDEMHDVVHSCYTQARRVSFLPDDRLFYSELEKRIINIAREKGAKMDFYQKFKPRTEDIHTDEQLVAASLYTAANGAEVSILTRDSDILRIMSAVMEDKELKDYLSNGNGRIRVHGLSKSHEVIQDFDSSPYLAKAG